MRKKAREIKRDQNMVLNLLRYHHRDKYIIYVLVTVYSQQYKLGEVQWGPRKQKREREKKKKKLKKEKEKKRRRKKKKKDREREK